MAHSNENIESALRAAIKDTVGNGEEDVLTVRYIRGRVEESLKLVEGFFVTDAWKAKSKQIIKVYAAELLNAKAEAEEEAKAAAIEVTPKSAKKQAALVKKVSKRVAQPDKSRPAKRRKKEVTPPSDPSEEEEEDEPEEEPSDLSDEEDESGISEFDDSDISDAPKTKKNAKFKPKAKTPARRRTKKKTKDESEDEDISEVVSDIEDNDAPSTPPKTGKKAKDVDNKRKSMVADSDVESEEEEAIKKSISPKKSKSQSLPQRERSKSAVGDDDEDDDEDGKADTKEETKVNDSDSSEMSVVIDEAPKPKKRGRNPKSDGTSTSKPSKPKLTKDKPAAKELSPTELQIKTLQSHLVKCGVRKIWAFELKPYGEDNKAKVRHLQDMLKDIGMTGRFSEQRAKEIKELRELQADLEAVKEGEKNWGLEGGRRSRGQRKSLKESSVEESEDEDGDNAAGKTRSRSTSEKPSKAARAKQELAFLGDEDESDSD